MDAVEDCVGDLLRETFWDLTVHGGDDMGDLACNFAKHGGGIAQACFAGDGAQWRALISHSFQWAFLLRAAIASLPKQGRSSVGVARQYCGALGKIANCQSIVTWHWKSGRAHWPLAGQLYLPEQWTNDPARMARSGVPEGQRLFREKWRIALELLDEMKPQLPAYEAIVFDAGYGVVQPLLAELEKRNEPYMAQVPGNIAAWPLEAKAALTQSKGRGRPRKHAVMHDRQIKPLTMEAWRDKLLKSPEAWRPVRLPREGAHSVRTTAVRVQGSPRASKWRQPGSERWLLIEKLSGGEYKYHLSNLPPTASLEGLVGLAHQRWSVEQGCLQLKEELGLDHFEGRSWRGLHHHLTLCFMAYGLLTRLRASKTAHPA